jgi:hypothetical protein
MLCALRPRSIDAATDACTQLDTGLLIGGVFSLSPASPRTLTGCWNVSALFFDAEQELQPSSPALTLTYRLLRRNVAAVFDDRVPADNARAAIEQLSVAEWTPVTTWVTPTATLTDDNEGVVVMDWLAHGLVAVTAGEYRMEARAVNSVGLHTIAMCPSGVVFGEWCAVARRRDRFCSTFTRSFTAVMSV